MDQDSDTTLVTCHKCGCHLETAIKHPEIKSTEPTLEVFSAIHYEHLPREKGVIRILKLHPGSPENPDVICELETNEFKDERDEHEEKTGRKTSPRSYEALSWCWGIDKPNSYISILVQGQPGQLFAKSVKSELLAALKALRYRTRPRYLWIDMICINQENIEEKNHQVEMMSYIYGCATRVCIWLGESSHSSQVALRFIDKEVLQLRNFDSLTESKQAMSKWDALQELMQRPWFSRRWVVQEIALAKKALIYCGKDRISWRKFAIAVELFVEVETATHRLSEVIKTDLKYFHMPGT